MSTVDETMIEGQETIICNAIMALWQRGLFEAAYAPISFKPLEFMEDLFNPIAFTNQYPYLIRSPNPELQSQFPVTLWLIFQRATVEAEIKRILDVRSALIETLKLAENDLRAKFEEVKSAKAQ